VSWSYKKLSEICELNIGKTPSRSEKSYWEIDNNGGEIWLSIADITRCKGLEIFESKEKITSKGASLFKSVEAGTLMMSFKLSIGKLAIAGADLYTNEAIVALPIKNKNEVDTKFLYYFLSFYDWDKESENDVKVKGKTLNKAKLKEILVLVPPLISQQKIVTKLDLIFAEIENSVRVTESSIQRIDLLFSNYLKEMFRDISLGNASFKKFDECIEKFKFKNKIQRSQYLSQGDYPIVSQEVDLINGYWSDKQDVINVDKPVIVFGDHTRAIKYIDFNFVAGADGTKILIPNNFLESRYFYYFLLANQIEGKGYARHYRFLKELNVPIVSLSNQKEAFTKLDRLKFVTENSKRLLLLKADGLAHLKKSVLSQAFNGELVKD
jgi:type I restriction enzyme, S subunit